MVKTGPIKQPEPPVRLVFYMDSNISLCNPALERLTSLCRVCLENQSVTKIIDIHEDVAAFEDQGVLAVPTLDIFIPGKERMRFVGDLTQAEMLLTALGMGQTAGKMMTAARKMRETIK